MTCADEIRKARQLLDLTQMEFAELIGSTQRSVSCWERGKEIPKKETMEKIRIALTTAGSKVKKRGSSVQRPVTLSHEEVEERRRLLWGKAPSRETTTATVAACCPKNCYYRGIGDTCDYILIQGLPRPCPIGKKCTVYAPKKGPRFRDTMMTIRPEPGKKGVMR